MVVVDQNDATGTTTNVKIIVNSGMDPSGPLCLHSSENPGDMLVSVAFSGIGYISQRHIVLRGLSFKKKFILSAENFNVLILSHLSSDNGNIVMIWQKIADNVEYASNVVELQKELEDRCEQTNCARLYQIQKEINDLSQRVLDITSYYTQLMKLWEELSTLSAKTRCIYQCTCGAKENMHKEEQDERLIQFLLGLNKVYTTVRESILMMNPLPSMAQDFSLLIQDKKQ